MAYLAQPVIVGSPNVLVVEDATMNLAGNIVRSSHYIPDPYSATSTSADATSLHPSLKSLPYPLALPPVMSPTSTSAGNNGADLASFEEDEDEDADTEDSRSLLSAVESFNDGASTSSVVFGSFHDNNNGIPVGSLRGQSVLAANVRSSSRSPVAYHRIAIIPTGGATAVPATYPTIPTIPGAAVASNSSVLTHRDGIRVPGTRANSGVLGASSSSVTQNMPRADEPAAEEPRCNACNLELGNASPLTTAPSNKIVTNQCPNAHQYHLQCFQSILLQPALTSSTLPMCPAPCSHHVPARAFLHVVSPAMKQLYLQVEMEIMSRGDDDDF